MKVVLAAACACLGISVPAAAQAQDARIVASVLPQARSVEQGETATAFATLINASDVTARNCRIAAGSAVPAALGYRTTDPATNAATGTPDTPVDIPARGSQSFVFSLETLRDFHQAEVELRFECDNAAPAIIRDRVNLFRLSAADPSIPTPDIIAQAATVQNDGFVHLPDAARVGAFAVATANVGGSGTITVRAESGDANPPVSYEICRTNSATGACDTPRAATQTVSMGSGTTATFGVFVRPNGVVPRRAALYRAVVIFEDSTGVERGSTSVAIQTDSGTPPEGGTAVLGFPAGQSFTIASAEDSADVPISVGAANFALGTDGEAALSVDGQVVGHYSAAETVTLGLPGGQHEIELRLLDMSGEPAFPDARAEAVVTVSLPGAPYLALPSGFTSTSTMQLVDFHAYNIFPESETYRGTLNGEPIEVLTTGQGRMAFLVPDLGGFSGSATLEVAIDGTAYSLAVPVTAAGSVSDPSGEIDTLVDEVLANLQERRAAAFNAGQAGYVAALDQAIADVSAARNELKSMTAAEQVVAVRMLRNVAGPNASPLLAEIARDMAMDAATDCEAQMRLITRRVALGNLLGLSLVGEGAVTIAASLAGGGGAVVGAAAVITGGALLYLYSDQVLSAIETCFSRALSAELAGRVYNSVSEDGASFAADTAMAEGDPVFTSNQPRQIDLTGRKLPRPATRLVINTLIDGLDTAGPLIPDAILLPARERLVALRDGESEVIPEIGDLSINVTSGDVTLDSFTATGTPGAFNLAFRGDQSGPFGFTVSYQEAEVAIEAELEVEAPTIAGFGVESIPPGVEVSIPIILGGSYDGLRLASDIADGIADIRFTLTPEPVMHVRILGDFIGVVNVPIEVYGPTGSSSRSVQIVATGFLYPDHYETLRCVREQRGSESRSCGLYIRRPVSLPRYNAGVDYEELEVVSIPSGMTVDADENHVTFHSDDAATGRALIRITHGDVSRTIPVEIRMTWTGSETRHYGFAAEEDGRATVDLEREIVAVTRSPANGLLAESQSGGGQRDYVPNSGYTGFDAGAIQLESEFIGTGEDVVELEHHAELDFRVVPEVYRSWSSSGGWSDRLFIGNNVNCTTIYPDGTVPDAVAYAEFHLLAASFDARNGEVCIDRDVAGRQLYVNSRGELHLSLNYDTGGEQRGTLNVSRVIQVIY